MSARIASEEAAESAEALNGIPARWAEISKPRAGSAAAALVAALMDHPILTMPDAIAIADGPHSSTFAAMNRLELDGVVHEVTGRKRDRVYIATEVLSEIHRLGDRIGRAVRAAG